MASEYETGHMRRIAAAEAALNREAVLRSADRSPSENIGLAFDLSEFASEFGGVLHGPDDEVAPVKLWRAAARNLRR